MRRSRPLLFAIGPLLVAISFTGAGVGPVSATAAPTASAVPSAPAPPPAAQFTLPPPAVAGGSAPQSAEPGSLSSESAGRPAQAAALDDAAFGGPPASAAPVPAAPTPRPTPVAIPARVVPTASPTVAPTVAPPAPAPAAVPADCPATWFCYPSLGVAGAIVPYTDCSGSTDVGRAIRLFTCLDRPYLMAHAYTQFGNIVGWKSGDEVWALGRRYVVSTAVTQSSCAPPVLPLAPLSMQTSLSASACGPVLVVQAR